MMQQVEIGGNPKKNMFFFKIQITDKTTHYFYYFELSSLYMIYIYVGVIGTLKCGDLSPGVRLSKQRLIAG